MKTKIDASFGRFQFYFSFATGFDKERKCFFRVHNEGEGEIVPCNLRKKSQGHKALGSFSTK